MADRTLEAIDAIAVARTRFAGVTIWKHYKGGVYEIEGFTLDTTDGSVRVTYRRIAGPGFSGPLEAGLQYSRPASEWFDQISEQIGDGSVPDDIVPRFRPARLEYL